MLVAITTSEGAIVSAAHLVTSCVCVCERELHWHCLIA